MESLVLEVRNPDTVQAIAEAAKRQGTTPEAAALELLETAVLAQRPISLFVSEAILREVRNVLAGQRFDTGFPALTTG